MKPGLEWIGKRRHPDVWIFCLLLMTGMLIYMNSLGNPFHYDDQPYIEENRNIRLLSNLPHFFTNPKTLSSNPSMVGHYRPLVVTSYAINYAVGGLNPAGYHLVNLGFHAGSAFLIFLIVKSMLTPALSLSGEGGAKHGMGMRNAAVWASLAAGLIFLVHPFNSEVVNYITARSSVMSGFFYLLGFYCWVRYREAGAGVFYMACFLAFMGGMLSKEIVITLPVILWLYDLYFPKVPDSSSRSLFDWRTYIPYAPFILIVAVPYLIMRASSFGGILTHFRRGIGTQIFTELPVLVKYLKLFIFPAGLNVDHYAGIYKTFFVLPVIGSAAVLVLFLAAAIILYRSKAREWKMVSFFVIWFFVVMLPTTVIPLNAILQENRGYLAIVTFAVLAGVLLSKLETPSLKKWRLSLAVLIILLLVYGSATIYRNSIWRDGLTLWGDAAAKSPESPRAFSNLGTALARQGENDLAVERFHRALELANPESGIDPLNIHYNLGSVYQQMGSLEMAVKEYSVVMALAPGDSRPYYNLGVIYQQQNETAAAIDSYKKVLELAPSDFRTYHNLGLIYQKNGDLMRAAGYYKTALELNPGYDKSRYNLGTIYVMEGDMESAKEVYTDTIKINPDYMPAYYSLGMIYEKEGNPGMAIKIYREAAVRTPANQSFLERIKILEEERHGR